MPAIRHAAVIPLAFLLVARLLAAEDPSPALAEARALFAAHKNAEAVIAYEALAQQNPTNPEPFRCLGHLALRRNDGEAAVRWFEKALAAEPTHAETHRALGDSFGMRAQQAGVLSKFGLAKKCLASYQRAAELDPNGVRNRESLFNYYVNAPAIAGGGKDKARAEAEALQRLDPARGALAFATLHLSEKKYSEALAAYDTYLRSAPDDYYVNYLVGKLCDTNGIAPDRGLAALRHCLELPQLTPPAAPKHQHAHWRIGNILKAHGDLAGARAAYETALQIDPNFKYAADGLKSLPPAMERSIRTN